MTLRIAGMLAGACATLFFTGCSAEAQRARTLERAGKYFAAGEYEEAKIAYLNVLRETPKSAIANERVGIIWLEQGAPVRALPYLHEARQLSPGNAAIRTKLALALVATERVAEARREAFAVLRDTTAHDEALVILSETIRSRADYDATFAELKKSPARDGVMGVVAHANLLLLKDDLEAAEKTLTVALKRQPNSSIAHSALGTLRLRQGDRKKAAPELKLAADLAPPRALARVRYAEFIALSGAQAEAEASLGEMLRKTPDFLLARRLLAELHLKAKKFEAAEEQVRALAYRDSASIDASLLQAGIDAAKGAPEKAVARLEALHREQPKLGVVSLALARLLVTHGQIERAAEVLRAALVHQPDHPELSVLLAELYLRTGKPDAAVPVLARLLSDDPHFQPAQTLLITGLRNLGLFDEAAATAREQVRVHPKDARPQLLLGQILQRQNKWSEAKTCFERALELRSDSLPALTALVDCELRTDGAESALQRVLAFQEKSAVASADVVCLQAAIYLTQKKWAQAEETLRRALAADPHHDRAYNLMKLAFDANKEDSRALEHLAAVRTASPGNPRALLLSAVIHAARKDIAAAKAAYEQVLTVKPNQLVALNNLAALCAEEPAGLGRAHDLARKARELDPASPMIADTLGWILHKKQDYARALELLEESAAKLPDNPEVLFHVAIARQHAGRTEEARAAFERAANARGDFPGKAEIPQRLAMLRVAKGD